MSAHKTPYQQAYDLILTTGGIEVLTRIKLITELQQEGRDAVMKTIESAPPESITPASREALLESLAEVQ